MAENILNEITREGYDKLNAELENLITVVRAENAERLKEAISLGDISENAEYDAAKEAQAETEKRISDIEEILRTVKIVDELSSKDSKSIQTGRTVKIKDMELNKTYTLKLVGSTEANPLEGKLSNASPVGNAIIDCKKGDTVDVHAPDGIIKYKILDVQK